MKGSRYACPHAASDLCDDKQEVHDTYKRLQKIGTWMEDELCWYFLLWFAIGGRSCSNFLASTVPQASRSGIPSSGPYREARKLEYDRPLIPKLRKGGKSSHRNLWRVFQLAKTPRVAASQEEHPGLFSNGLAQNDTSYGSLQEMPWLSEDIGCLCNLGDPLKGFRPPFRTGFGVDIADLYEKYVAFVNWGVLFSGVLVIRALLAWVFIRTPDCWNPPLTGTEEAPTTWMLGGLSKSAQYLRDQAL